MPKLEPIREAPTADVVETLEEALRQAKSGEMIAVAVAGVMRNKGAWVARASSSHLSGLNELAAVVALVHHRIMKAWDEY